MKQKNKKIDSFKIKILAIVALTVVITGTVTYGFFSPSRTQTGNNTLISGCFNVTMEENTSSIALTNAYPIDDEKGLAGTPYTITITNTCDTEARYHLLLDTKNGSFSSSHIKVAVDTQVPKILADYQTNTSYLAGTDYSSSNILKSGNLAKNESATMSIRLWIDSATTYEDVQGKNWEGQVRIVNVVKAVEYANSPAMKTLTKLNATSKGAVTDFARISPYIEVTVNSKYNNLTNVANDATYPYTYDSATGVYTSTNKTDGTTSTITFSPSETKNFAFCYEVSSEANCDKGTVYLDNVSKGVFSGTETSCIDLGTIGNSNTIKVTYRKDRSGSNGNDEIKFYLSDDVTYGEDDSGVYEMEDDYGTSYYYRGAVENNYVKFAGFYWRIIRINGDGSLRILYDGTQAYANGTSNAGRVALTSVEWNTTNRDDAKYVGYMYGGANGEASTSKAQAQTNETDTNIKTKLDAWYKTNIADKGYGEAVSDTIFCNDRSTPGKEVTAWSSDTGKGFGTNVTGHGAFGRFMTGNNGSSISARTEIQPTFKCPQKNDAFTVNDTVVGNGALTYPVGLITADEIVAGGSGKYGTTNQKYYLYKTSSYWYWSLSPNALNSNGYALVFNVGSGGGLGNGVVYGGGAVVPVINLSAEYANTLTGTGTAEDPYQAA